MRIELDIPDWGEEEKRNFFVFAGMELVAYKYHGETKWKVKTGRCKMCGKCCKNCAHLKPDGPHKLMCAAGSNRPFSCSAGVTLGRIEGCSETYVD